ncbi:MAG TPA: hypothetical protein VLK53_09675 [Gaiellaceae bacterium]|nr:hypothetical protein [Gaiellaceae bacterium]
MKRTPRPAALIFIGAIAALLVASGATGNSKAVGPENKTPPSVSPYLVKVGSKLTGDKGLWQSTKDIAYSYTWLRCNVDGENCSKISGATETTYKIVQADVAHTIRLQITAKDATGTSTEKSNPTAQIVDKAGAPQATAPPVITGTPTVGQQLNATNGNWNGTKPITYVITWERCNTAVTECTDIGHSGPSYRLVNGDAGHRMRVQVTATNSDGKSSATSVPTTLVQPQSSGGGGGGGGNAIDVKDVGPAGERLIVDKVTFNPNPVTSKNVPINVTITVKDTNGKLVKGALVFFRSTPVVASIPTDAPTGSDGVVRYTIHPEGDFPIKNNYSVQFFVKAYRQGDPSLAGISGTRLVQVATHKP